MMVVSADSISTSFTPAASVWPIGLVGSTWISKCRPLCLSSTAFGWGGIALEGDELGGVLQADFAAVLQGYGQLAVLHHVGGGVDVGSAFQRGGFVEEGAGEGDHLVTADLVVALALLGAVLR